MAIDPLAIGIGAAWGALLGLLFFGGLWWSLKGISRRRSPRRFLGISFFVRAVAALAGLWLALQHSVAAFGAALVGFGVMRFLMTRWIGLAQKGGHHRAH